MCIDVECLASSMRVALVLNEVRRELAIIAVRQAMVAIAPNAGLLLIDLDEDVGLPLQRGHQRTEGAIDWEQDNLVDAFGEFNAHDCQFDAISPFNFLRPAV